MTAAPPLLEVNGLTKSFGALKAISDLSFTVAQGEVLGIMGPNGAGKSTLFGLIMGSLPADSGEVRFAGQSLAGLKANAVCRLGLGRTYQIPQPFAHMSVLENLLVGGLYAHSGVSLAQARAHFGAHELLAKAVVATAACCSLALASCSSSHDYLPLFPALRRTTSPA